MPQWDLYRSDAIQLRVIKEALIFHTVKSHPLIKLADDVILQLQSADNTVVTQLTDNVFKALAK